MGSENDIGRKKSSRIIYTDVSNSGWGTTSGNNKTGGPFNFEENKYHINAKGLLAVKFTLRMFVNIENIHVKLMSDDITTVYGINKMG